MEDERGSRVRARKRSLPGTAARKIASCVDCSKRFITFSGSDVCIDCRRINGRVSPGPPKNDPVNNASATVRRRLGQISSKDDSSSIRKENRENKLADTTCSRLPSSESAIFGSANAPSDDCHGSSIDSGLQPIMPIHKEQKESEEEVATIDQILLNEKLSQKTLPVSKVASDINDVEVLDIVTEHGCDRRDRRGNSDSNSGNNDGQGSRSHETDVQLIDDSSDKDNKTDRREVSICADKSLQSDSIINNLANSSHVRKSQHASSSLFFATSSQGVGDASYRCFICNTPLSAVQGLKGRLNHIKRCGKKHGIQAGDGAKGLNGDQMGGALIGNGKCAETINYDRHGWHDDKDAGMAIDDVVDTTEPRQPSRADDYDKKVHSKDDNASTIGQQKQSNLTSFFSRPVRSLDKVLLQGARNEAKKEQIACKRQQLPASNAQSSARGRGGGSWKKRKREPPISCPQYKRISNTTVLVDAFHYANPALPQTHFLSHFHSDHYGGITKNWSGGVIYCSIATASLVHSQLGVAKKYLHPLPMHTKTVIDANGRSISVTLLNANHCPGAVMFLFELSNGKKILHVGDFRWDRNAMLGQPQIRQFWQESNGMSRLDDIYLDTTYCNEKYSTMPSQEQAIAAAVSTAREEIEGPPAKYSLLPISTSRRKTSTLLLFGSYTIGKEKIFMSCAQSLNMRIYVEPRKFRILSALNFSRAQMARFTTAKSEAQIWVVPMGHCTFQHLDEYLSDANSSSKGLSGGYSRVVAFRPTGWTHNGNGPNKKGAPTKKANGLITTRRSGNKTIHGVPYSEHSSFSELVDCLLCLRPKRIIPTVSVTSSEAQIARLLQATNEKELGE